MEDVSTGVTRHCSNLWKIHLGQSHFTNNFLSKFRFIENFFLLSCKFNHQRSTTNICICSRHHSYACSQWVAPGTSTLDEWVNRKCQDFLVAHWCQQHQLADSGSWCGIDIFFLLLLLLFFSSFSPHGGDISWMCEGCSGSVFVRYVIVAVVSDICVATTDDCWPTCMAGHFLDTFKYYEPFSPGLQRPLGAPHIVGRLRGIAALFNLL